MLPVGFICPRFPCTSMQGHGKWAARGGSKKLPAQCVRGTSIDWLADAQRFGVNPSGKRGGSVELCRRWEPEDCNPSQKTGCGGVLPRCVTSDPNMCLVTALGIATGILTRWYSLRCSTPSSFTGGDENRNRNKALVHSVRASPRDRFTRTDTEWRPPSARSCS